MQDEELSGLLGWFKGLPDPHSERHQDHPDGQVICADEMSLCLQATIMFHFNCLET
jgi:hypothetical protein